MHLTDIWRILNTLAAVTAVAWLMWDLKVRHHDLTRRSVYLRISLLGFLLSVIIGSVETILSDAPIGFRTAINTAAVVWTLIGLSLGHNDYKNSLDYKD